MFDTDVGCLLLAGDPPPLFQESNHTVSISTYSCDYSNISAIAWYSIPYKHADNKFQHENRRWLALVAYGKWHAQIDRCKTDLHVSIFFSSSDKT